MRNCVVFLALIFVLCGFAPLPNQAAENPGRRSDPQFQQRRNERDENLEKMEKDRVKRLNKERQERLKRDTDQLLTLATQLKQYVDRTNENILSIDVIRKAEQIEKLAHQVREKMKADQYQTTNP